MPDWSSALIDRVFSHGIGAGIVWHGALMLAAWLVLMPAALLVARFYKITPGQDWPRRLDNPFWFVNHRRLGHAIGILGTLAVFCIGWINNNWVAWPTWHAMAGWVLFALGWFQIIGAWCRGTHGGPVDPFTRQPRPPAQWPGDHFSLTRRRIFFEYSHKIAGYALLPVLLWQVGSGLADADAPAWLWGVVGLWIALLVGVFAWLQAAGRCIDTYQAIWGLDDSLPGYRRRPIGWGVTRIRR